MIYDKNHTFEDSIELHLSVCFFQFVIAADEDAVDT